MALSLQDTQKNIEAKLESPSALHLKGITITPGGFLRQNRMAVACPRLRHQYSFNSVPYDGANASALSEFFGSGRQSRMSMLAEGKLSSATIRGYVETDFLSAGVTSNNNQSNSYTLRQRQAYAQAALNSGWTFTGGQMWSLVAETKKGVENRSEATPMTIDPAYTVGFSWARQYGFRVAKKFNDQLTWAVSVEDSQATLGGHLAQARTLHYRLPRD